MGHLAAARLVGVPLVSFSVKPIGAALKFDFTGVSYAREAAVHLGGSVLGMLASLLAVLGGAGGQFFCGISTVLSAVNLLPITGFDGGGILSCVLSSVLQPDTSARVSRAVSIVFLLLLWAAVLWIELRVGANLSLLAFVLFFV